MLCGRGQRRVFRPSRRTILSGFGGLVGAWPPAAVGEAEVGLGLTAVVLDNDMKLSSLLQRYLVQQLDRPVRLFKQRSYREASVTLLAGQLHAAWISDFLYVQYHDRLALLAVPLYQHQPFHQSYVIVNEASKARAFDDIRGSVHAFSDPDSTSGYLITRWLLALRRETPAEFFRSFFFTNGYRNVIRAVGNGLAESGSIDGYVWDVIKSREPELADKTRIVFRSEWLGFPPVVALDASRDLPATRALAAALLDMTSDRLGREILSYLALDGFTTATPSLYESTAEKWSVVKAQV
jgi:phosphonate transport system substrate-binding protein